jgi:hypothetical protein
MENEIEVTVPASANLRRKHKNVSIKMREKIWLNLRAIMGEVKLR